MLRERDNAKVCAPIAPHQRFTISSASSLLTIFVILGVQLLQARDFLFFLMKGLEQLPPVSETVYALRFFLGALL